jgi:hypothetical protein
MAQDNSNPSPQESGTTSEQPTKAVGSVVPKLQQVQTISLKALQAIMPPLAKLTQKLAAADAGTTTDTETEAASKSGSALTKYIGIVRSQVAKLLQLLLQGLQKLEQKLQKSLANQPTSATPPSTTNVGTADPMATAVTTDTPQPVAPLPAGETESPFAQNDPKGQFKEFGKVLVANTIFVLEKLDPWVNRYWQKFSSLSVVQSNWQKVESSDPWKKFNTAFNSALRTLSEKVGLEKAPQALKTILSKKAALVFILAVLLFLNLTKPLGWFHGSKVAKAPRPVAAPTQVVSEPIEQELVPPERGDAPISPERIMIADIQDQVLEVSSKYGEALIKSVKTNFRLGRLVVQLTDSWYQLDPLQQERMMADLYGRSQSLNFKKLLVSDANLNLVARSPVVGTQMVILRQSLVDTANPVNPEDGEARS